jgi:hypothetical protein
MRLVPIALAACLAAASPAFAQSGGDAGATSATLTGAHAEVHTGLGWTDGQTANGTLGASVGYDLQAGKRTFVGVEQSADKVLSSQAKLRWGSTARVGYAVTGHDKIYALTGYSYGVGANAVHSGAGVEHTVGPVFTRVEYRHYFTEGGNKDDNAATLGVGVKF